MIGLGIFAGVFAVYGLGAARAERAGLSRPFVFLVAGAVVALTGAVDPLLLGEADGAAGRFSPRSR